MSRSESSKGSGSSEDRGDGRDSESSDSSRHGSEDRRVARVGGKG
jgi:hypothetical protein